MGTEQSKQLDSNDINFSRMMLKTFPDAKLKEIHTIPLVFNLSSNLIEVIPPIAHAFPNLRHVLLQNNRLTSFPSALSLCSNLSKLELQLNRISSIDHHIYPSLKDVNLDQNILETLSHDIGVLFPSIGYLSFSRNQLTFIPRISSPTITHLNLESNLLTHLKGEIKAPQLTILNFSFNTFDTFSFPRDSKLPKLDSLDLRMNRIRTLDVKSFSSLTNLTALYLTNNNLEDIPDDLVDHLPNLKMLWIGENQLERLPLSIINMNNPNSIFAGFNRLRWVPPFVNPSKIGLKVNLLESLLGEVPVLGKDVTNFTADSNVIEDIRDDVFREAKRLISLSFRHNLLTTIPSSLQPLTLSTLVLSQNNLTTFPISILRLTAIEYLDLSMNRIESIPEKINKLTSLNHFNLSFNNISRVPASLFTITTLKQVTLAGNNISSLPGSQEVISAIDARPVLPFGHRASYYPGVQRPIPAKVEKLNLSLNNFQTVPEIVQRLIHLHSLSMAGNKLTTIPNRLLHTLTNLHRLDLSFNQIDRLSDDFIPRVFRGIHIDLSHNRLTSIPNCILQMNMEFSPKRLQELSDEYFKRKPVLVSKRDLFVPINPSSVDLLSGITPTDKNTPLSIHPIAFPASPVNINVGLVNYTDLSFNHIASIRLGEEMDDYLGLYDRHTAEVAHADQCPSPRDSSKAYIEPTLLPHFVKEPGRLSYLDFAFLSGASRLSTMIRCTLASTAPISEKPWMTHIGVGMWENEFWRRKKEKQAQTHRLSDAEIVRTIAASSRAITGHISAIRPSPPTSESTSSSDGSSDVDSLVPVPIAPGRSQPVATVAPEVQFYKPSPVDSVPLCESCFPSAQILLQQLLERLDLSPSYTEDHVSIIPFLIRHQVVLAETLPLAEKLEPKQEISHAPSSPKESEPTASLLSNSTDSHPPPNLPTPEKVTSANPTSSDESVAAPQPEDTTADDEVTNASMMNFLGSQLDREMEEDEDEVSDGWMERQDVVLKDRLRASEFTRDELHTDPFLHILLDKAHQIKLDTQKHSETATKPQHPSSVTQLRWMDQFGFDRSRFTTPSLPTLSNTDEPSSLLPYHTEDEKAYTDKLDLILNEFYLLNQSEGQSGEKRAADPPLPLLRNTHRWTTTKSDGQTPNSLFRRRMVRTKENAYFAQIKSTQLAKYDPAPSMLSGLIGLRDSYSLASHPTRPFDFQFMDSFNSFSRPFSNSFLSSSQHDLSITNRKQHSALNTPSSLINAMAFRRTRVVEGKTAQLDQDDDDDPYDMAFSPVADKSDSRAMKSSLSDALSSLLNTASLTFDDDDPYSMEEEIVKQKRTSSTKEDQEEEYDPYSMEEEIVKRKRMSSSKPDEQDEDDPYNMDEDIVEEMRMGSVGMEEQKEDDDPYEMGNDTVHEASSEPQTKKEENTPQPPSIADQSESILSRLEKSKQHLRSLTREPRNFPIGIPNAKSSPDFTALFNNSSTPANPDGEAADDKSAPSAASGIFKAFFHDPSLVHRDIRSSTVDFTRQPKHPPSLSHHNVGCAETNGERQTMEDAVLLLPVGGWNLQTLLETGQVDRVERLLTFPQELRFTRIGLQEMSNIEFELERAMHPQPPNDDHILTNHQLCPAFSEDVNGCGLFGVFDGHKGPQTATFLAAHFVSVFLETVREMLGIDKQTSNVSPSSSPHPQYIPTLLRATMENLTKKMRLLRVDDGACALLALITPTTAFVTNVGDCRAVLVSRFSSLAANPTMNSLPLSDTSTIPSVPSDTSLTLTSSTTRSPSNSPPPNLPSKPVFTDVRHMQPQTTHNTNILVRPQRSGDVVSLFTGRPLTIDHKPVCQSERDFITSVGGFVNMQRRVNGVLAVARAMGDFDIFPAISDDPDVFTVPLQRWNGQTEPDREGLRQPKDEHRLIPNRKEAEHASLQVLPNCLAEWNMPPEPAKSHLHKHPPSLFSPHSMTDTHVSDWKREDIAIVLACDGVFDALRNDVVADLVCGWMAGTVSDSAIQRAGLIIEADDDNAYTALDEDSGPPRVDKGKLATFAALRVRVASEALESQDNISVVVIVL